MAERFRASIYELEEDSPSGVVTPLEQAMSTADARDPEAQTLHLNDAHRRLVQFWENAPLYFANFATMRYPGPGRASPRREITRFNLADGELFAYQTAMLYDSELNLAFIESARPGMGPGAVAKYFRRFVPDDTRYKLTPRLDDEARRRALRQRQFRTVVMRVASGPAGADERDEGLGAITAIAQGFDAGFIDVELSMGRERNRYLDAERILGFLPDALRAADEGRVTKLKVNARDHEDDPLELIDLLQHRESRERTLEVDAAQRTIPHEARWGALENIRNGFVGE